MLAFLDAFFLVFHACFTLFNMTGWIWRRTRKAHLATISLTAASWFVLGIWYGWGYCFCTDWHWQVREKMGRPISSYSYIHFLILEITGIDMDQALVDHATLVVFLFCLAMTVALNARDAIMKRRGAGNPRRLS